MAKHARPSRTEPILWTLFSGGGIVAALLFPIHVAILGIAFAAGWLPDDALSYDRMIELVRNPLTKIYLAVLVALPLYHWAHRFRFTLHHELGIERGQRLLALALYGSALAGTVLTILVLLRI